MATAGRGKPVDLSGPPETGLSRFDFRILGSLEVLYGGQPVELRRVKERTVLGILLLRVNQIVSLDYLTAGLWADLDRPRPAATLRVYVSRLRQALALAGVPAEQVVTTSGTGYVLEVPAETVDARRFEQLAAAGRLRLAGGEFEAAAETLAEALALWRGPVLADLPLTAAIEPEVVRLEEARLSVLEERVDAELQCGRHHELVGDLERLVTETPLRERLWGQKMTALYRCGRQAEALRAYEELRVLLREQLGIRPSPALQQLERAVLDQDPVLMGQTSDPVTTPGRTERPAPGARAALAGKHNFPAQVTALVGRAKECAEVGELLGRHRLVTLTGIGGVGKTRVALEVGAERAVIDTDGAWLVELDGLSDPSVVPAAVASALGADESSGEGARAALLAFLRSKQMLLVLDNCEHLLDASAALVGEILATCPDVTVLATSQERLRIDGELAWPVAALSDDADATRLFTDRAAIANPTLRLDESASAVITAICARLDFLPLSIELAAGWVRLLTPEEILARLDDRFALLSGGSRATPRGTPARHQTLRHLLSWSYGLLTGDEQALLGRVAIFRGGFCLEAAEHVSAGLGLTDEPASVLQLLAGLVDKSLVGVEHRTSRTTRYRLLETVRQFAWGQVEQAGQVAAHGRHLAWCADFATASEADLNGPEQATVFDDLEAEHDNFRHALAWAGVGDGETGLRLAVSLGQFWTVRGYQDEGRKWLDLLLRPGLGTSTELRARAKCWLGSFAWSQGDSVSARKELSESLELWASTGSSAGRSETLAVLGDGWAANGALDEARSCYEEALGLATSSGHVRVRVQALKGLGALERAVGNWAGARALFEECLSTPGADDDPRIRAQVLNNLAVVLIGEGDTAAAAALLRDSLAVKRTLRDRPGIAITLINLGALACDDGALEDAEGYYEEALEMHDLLGNERGIAYAVQGLGEVATSRGDYRLAARLFGAAATTRERIGVVLFPQEQDDADRFLRKARTGAGDEAFEGSWTKGRRSGPRLARSVGTWTEGSALD